MVEAKAIFIRVRSVTEMNKGNNKKRYKRITLTVIVIPLILIALFVLFVFQAPQYSYHYVKCGFKEPVKGFKDVDSSAPGRYTLPSDTIYSETGYLNGNKYYCTEQEAIDDGGKHYY